MRKKFSFYEMPLRAEVCRTAIFVHLVLFLLSCFSCKKNSDPELKPSLSGAPPSVKTQTPSLPMVQKGPSCVRPLKEPPPPLVFLKEVCPKDPSAQAMVPVRRVTVEEASAGVDAEIVSSPADTERGLMYRTSMPEDRGMLFVMKNQVHTFWMRNTCLSLDMLFIDENGFVNGILENVPPMNDDERSVGCVGKYVLEVNAGWTRRHAVKPGMKLKIPE